MKIKVSHLRSLIRECILTEEEMRNVTYLTQDNIVKLLKNYGVDKQVALEEDVKFYEMVKKYLNSSIELQKRMHQLQG